MNYNDFLAHNNKKDEHFWYKARNNLIFKLLNSELKENSNIKILDIGCGTGLEIKMLKKFGQITALDFDKNALELARKEKCKLIFSDIEKYKFNKKYDVICAFDVLEHIANDQRVMMDIYKNLNDGGIFLFTVPAYNFLFGPHDFATGHKRRYCKKKLKEKLKNTNFKNIKIYYWNILLFPAIAIFRLFKKILLTKLIKTTNYNTDIKINFPIINDLLYIILNIENKIFFKNKFMPFGLTIYGIAKK